jgi:site-specific DNA-methyltransferase (adenine-specific)
MNITNEDNMGLMARYEDNYFDLAIVDPPYGIERFKKGFGTTRFKMDKRTAKNGIEWDSKPSKEYWAELFRVSKNQIVWGANNFVMPPSEYFCIWNKKQTVDNFATAEYAWVSMGLKKPAKMFDYGIHKHNHTNKIHPTEKPVALYEWLLMNYAKEGDNILDTHLGSGSIALACHNLGYDLTGCELDEEYYTKAMIRLKEHKQQLRMF